MCIICVKPNGKKDFEEKIFKNCWSKNDDGAGYAVWDAHKKLWRVRKGFMDYNHFIKKYYDEKFTKDQYVIVHFRIGTSGLMDAGNTHPFEICDDFDRMRITTFESPNIAFHNGTVGVGDKKYSDTMHHIATYLFPLLPLWDDVRVKDHIAEALLSDSFGSHSRWVVCVGPNVKFYGKWHEDEEKRHYSNDNYKYEWVHTSYSGGYGSTYNSVYTPNTSKVPQQPWTHGFHQGQHGFWKGGIFTSWKEWMKKKKTDDPIKMSLTSVTEAEKETTKSEVDKITDQNSFDFRYKISMGTTSAKFVQVMDWRRFARDMMILNEKKKTSAIITSESTHSIYCTCDKCKTKDTNVWKEPSETEKWAMGLNSYEVPVKTTDVKDQPETTEPKTTDICICPYCFEETWLEDSPFTVGDTICKICGCVFTDETKAIHLFDHSIHTKFVASRM